MFCTLRGICVICLTGACKCLPQLCSSETDSGSKERSCNLELKAEQLSSSVKVEVPALHCVVKVSTHQYCLAGL